MPDKTSKRRANGTFPWRKIKVGGFFFAPLDVRRQVAPYSTRGFGKFSYSRTPDGKRIKVTRTA